MVGWDEASGSYVVQTFGGRVLQLSEDELAEGDAVDPQDGGFDVAWPNCSASFGTFASDVAKSVQAKGFCVIQMLQGDQVAQSAMEMAKSLQYGRLSKDVEGEYLGVEADSKVCWLQHDLPGETSAEPTGMMTYDVEELGPDMTLDHLDGLSFCDKALAITAAALWPLTPRLEQDKGFIAWGRTNPLVRAGIEPGEEDQVRSIPVDAGSSRWADAHTAFAASKKLCLFYLVENGGGELLLVPKTDAYDFDETAIPLTTNKLVVIRCDKQGMDFHYKALGENLALQSWVLDVPQCVQQREQQLRVIDGPEEPVGARSNVMAVATRYAASAQHPHVFWSLLFAGADTHQEIPIFRWDVDVYYSAEQNLGFSSTRHSGLLHTNELHCFDNEFFGIAEAEANAMTPNQKGVLEVGYECLSRAGHNRGQLKGFKCGVFVGDMDGDMHDFANTMPGKRLHHYIAGKDRSVLASRLSHIMGMVGPISFSDTACSSALVALGACQESMRLHLEDQRVPSLDGGIQHGLVIASNTLTNVGVYIAESGAGMLSPQGRCFTFNDTADGYARGEGFGSMKMKTCDNSIDAAGRMAVLLGACVNQDGKSASLTAPHGPSQQEVLRASMREGGLDQSMITITECHGTGTPLGDPIEVGAVRSVFKVDRPAPVFVTSAKTNLGHAEGCAGAAGFTKCCLMLQFSTGAPNNHLHSLNPHLDVADFPACFVTESVDFGQNSGVTGVSSFGFAGTNARADIWGNCQHAHRYSISGTLTKKRGLIL